MTTEQFQSWWQLHYREAMGEALTIDEYQKYLMGLQELEMQEWQERSHGADLSVLREQVASLRQERDTLRREYAEATQASVK